MRTGWVCLLALAMCATLDSPAAADALDPLAFLDPPAADNALTEDESLPELELMVPKEMAVQPPACPQNVACQSPIGLCAISLNCTRTNLGPCCKTAAGPSICCINGNIWIRTCPCAGAGCPAAQITVQYCV